MFCALSGISLSWKTLVFGRFTSQRTHKRSSDGIFLHTRDFSLSKVTALKEIWGKDTSRRSKEPGSDLPSCFSAWAIFCKCGWRHHISRSGCGPDCSKRVLDIEHGTFTPLVFTTTGGMGKECLMYHSRLAQLIAIKKGEQYAKTISWIRTRTSFALLRSALVCLRGSRTRRVPWDIRNVDNDVEVVEGAIESDYWCLSLLSSLTHCERYLIFLFLSDFFSVIILVRMQLTSKIVPSFFIGNELL